MYSAIFDLMFAHFKTARMRGSYMSAVTIGYITNFRFTAESLSAKSAIRDVPPEIKCPNIFKNTMANLLRQLS